MGYEVVSEDVFLATAASMWMELVMERIFVWRIRSSQDRQGSFEGVGSLL